MRRFLQLLGLSLASALTAQCGGAGGDVLPPLTTDVDSVEVTPPSPSIVAGATTVTFQAQAFDAGNAPLDPAENEIEFSWSSLDPDIASIDQVTGVATGYREGTVGILVGARSGDQANRVTGHAMLQVRLITRIELIPPSLDLRVGEQRTMQAVARLADGTAVPEVRFDWFFFSLDNRQVAVVVDGTANPVTVRATTEGEGVLNAHPKVQLEPEAPSGQGRVVVSPENPEEREVTGTVVDAVTQNGIDGAVVARLDPPPAQVTTGGDGTFSFRQSPNLSRVAVSVSKNGYVATRVIREELPPGPINLGNIPLVRESAQPGGISGKVLNARTGEGIGGAQVGLSAGIVPTVAPDPTLPSATTDASGAYRLGGISAGTYTVIAAAQGFTTGSATGVVVGNGEDRPLQDVVLSPTGAGNDIRIVLTWGTTPADLDSHLTGPGFHVYYPANARGSLDSPPFARLDVDDQTGFGPETITIVQLNGTYRYSVHDFTNRLETASNQLGRSGATVKIYTTQGLANTFNVPNQGGNLWTVFTLSGAIDAPVITPVNQMSNVSDPGAVPIIVSDAAIIGQAVRAHPKATAR